VFSPIKLGDEVFPLRLGRSAASYSKCDPADGKNLDVPGGKLGSMS